MANTPVDPNDPKNQIMHPATPAEAKALLSQVVGNYNAAEEDEAGTGAETGGFSERVADMFAAITVVGGGTVLRGTGGITGQAMRQSRVLHAVLIIDGSGSMWSQRISTVDGANKFVADLARPNNPERNSIEVSIWIFSGDQAEIFNVANPNYNPNQPISPSNQERMDIVNMPVTLVPKIQYDDYNPGGGTPLNKTVISACAGASIRNARLANGGLQIGNKIMARVATMTYIVVLTDGMNTMFEEYLTGGKTISYADSEVKAVVQELLATESWMFMVIAVGDDMTSEEIANNLGFPLYFNAGDGGMAQALGFASQSVGAMSKAALGPGKVSASAAAASQANNPNAFLNP